MTKELNTPVQYLKGVGPKRANSFSDAGVRTVDDLLYYFPARYDDRASLTVISQLKEGQAQGIKAQVSAGRQRSSLRRRGFSITEAEAADETGKIHCVWFNQPYLKNYFQTGETYILYGKVERYGARLQMSSPEFEPVGEEDNENLNTGRIVPVYALPAGLTQRVLRRMIKSALDEYLPGAQDFLPYDIRSRNTLFNLAKSLVTIHFPESAELRQEAHRRLSFEEFFLFQLPLALRKSRKKEKKGIAHKADGALAREFIERLPFKLTASQQKVIDEIKDDMATPQPMQRLLQGDVGSGKTVVATIAGLIAVQGGYQAAFMAPTEILARQHFDKIKSQAEGIRIGLLSGSVDKKEKEKICRQIKSGEINLVIGTHALLEAGVVFKNLGLVVIDEQHKFGVGQRALLPAKGPNPDVLIMTATPIPRTLAITLYGDLDISVINELPPGRLPVKTLFFKEEEKRQAYAVAREHLVAGRQAYIIYPVIEESYALDLSGAKQMYEDLKTGEFRDFKIGLIHGRLKQDEQERVMLEFRNKKLNLLVATTVLEVGIDIPNATCMIIEHAERFGLSQLHQLRGRIGRGPDESFCFLISDAQTEEASRRLKAMVKYNDGFLIAEEDLKIRGPGDFFGLRQHGLTEMKIANPLTQMQLLKLARDEALKLIKVDPDLSLKQHSLLKNRLLQRFPEYEKLMVVG
jgi:ATP-dependent DNA helicase RecG